MYMYSSTISFPTLSEVTLLIGTHVRLLRIRVEKQSWDPSKNLFEEAGSCERCRANSRGREILPSRCEIEVGEHGTWVWMQSHGGRKEVGVFTAPNVP